MNNTLLLTALLIPFSGGITLAQRSDYEAERTQQRTQMPLPPAEQNARSGQYDQPGYSGQRADSRYNQNTYEYRGDDSRYDGSQYGPGRGYGNRGRGNYDADRRQDIFKVQHLDRIVNLTGWQKRDLLNIENYYDREVAQAYRYPGTFQRIVWQKSQDVLSILSPIQRDRLFAYKQYQAYNRGGYGSAWGNSSRGWTPPTGRRW